MNRLSRTPRLPPRSKRRRSRTLSRRGSIYVLVLACATIIFVVGVSTIALAHTGSRALVAERDAGRAALAARSAIEVVAAALTSNTSWRSAYTSSTAYSFTLDGVSVQAMLVDEADGNLSNNTNDPVRVYVLASVGQTRRIYSALLVPSGTAGLDVLRCALHSNKSVTVAGTASLTAGPLSTNTDLNNSGSIVGDAEVSGSYVSTGYTSGAITPAAPVKPMPSPAGVLTAFNGSTTINIVAALGATIKNTLLSSSSNPYGAPDSNGRYIINVPLLTTLTIQDSRFLASVVLNIPAGSTVVIANHVLWEPTSRFLPTIVVTGGGTLDIDSDANTLNEGGPRGNMNPPGTPYQTVSDNDQTDRYPAQITGIIHVTNAAASVIIENQSVLAGCLISEAPVSIQDTVSLTADTTLITNPPAGYANTTSGTMTIAPGSFRWESAESALIASNLLPAAPAAGSVPPASSGGGILDPALRALLGN